MASRQFEDWNGTDLPYVPSNVTVPDEVTLDEEYDEDIDPITHEVIRHSLWNANEEHGSTIENLAVSPITLETRDFQTGILTENAEFVFFGPYLQYFAGTMDLIANWILENRGAEPGIDEGDVFLSNDCWVGSPHQPDVALMAPVFNDGELFCWVSNLMHQNDVGGTVAGSFCPNAVDTYWDPPMFPPTKIVDGGDIVTETEAIYRRQSRTPRQLSMDLRAGIAGINTARERIGTLIEKYGASAVKGTMRKIIDSGEQAFKDDILSAIPDGEWSERVYQERAITGDNGVYPVELTVRKEGDQLTFTNEGTHDQVGSINQPFPGWRGSIIAVANLLMQPEQMGATGGMMKSLNFEPVPGTISCPEFGAAVSPAGIYANELGVGLANAVISKMLLSAEDEALREQAVSTTQPQWHLVIGEGENQRGDYYVAPMLDGLVSSTGARLNQDGAFAAGQFWIPEGVGPNVEYYEREWPILYLYRSEHRDTAGAGKRRGGNGGRLAFTLHQGSMDLGVYTTEGVPKGPGIFGGLPSSRGETRVVHDSDVNEQFEAGKIASEFDELAGERELTVGKGPAISLDDDSVTEWWWGSCAGLGDPILREPDRVAEDVANGTISKAHARETYGVVLTDDDAVDEPGTEAKRQEIRDDRLERAQTADELGIPEEVQ
ncbi:hydantoinase B/oxoprolinase family protein [Haladaptatus sp. CMAA 1911]|uniref:hydantoinase B/oxoprolinase family protein n=1 Tax=unclassified Haladaptatus TaxID=2622732 RepID=UPI0037544121